MDRGLAGRVGWQRLRRGKVSGLAIVLLMGSLAEMPAAQAQDCEVPLRVAGEGMQAQTMGCPEPPPPTPPHGALFTLQSVPAEMVVGQQYAVSISMQNKGYATWSAAHGYRLGSQNPADNGTWGLGRVDVPGTVHFNEAATFNFTVRAPTTPGTHNFQWQMLQEGVAWFGSPSPNKTITVHASTIIGNIDGIGNGNIEGWACSTRLSQPIDVHLYVGGSAGTGTGAGAYTANLASEPAVGSSCQSGGTAHRFRIPISQQLITQHGGKAIYIHGISPVGASNLTIGGSGAHHIPQNQAPSVSLTSPVSGTVIREGGEAVLRAQASDPDDGVASVTFYANGQAIRTLTAAPYEFTWTNIPGGVQQIHAEVSDTRGAATASQTAALRVSQVIGDIGGVTSGGIIWGWACSSFIDSSIDVHMYLGGSAGTGVFAGSFLANLASGGDVAAACQANGAAYVFHIPVTEALILQHGGKAIHIHGISPLQGPNHTIGRSGTFQIPANQAPAVAMTSPTSGNVQTPTSFTLKASATDADDGVAKVTFYANNQPIYTATQAPYQFPIANLSEGTHTYHAVAEDTRGAATTSASVSIQAIRVPWTPPMIPPRPGIKRQYVYDEHQQLCKVIEPETGTTVMGYDGAGNLVWSASGLSLPSTTACDRDAALASGRVVNRTYDTRNRLHTLQFPNQLGNQTWTYTATGLPKTITTYNSDLATSSDGAPVVNAYDYYNRGLLRGESVTQPGWYAWGIGYAYDRNANLVVQTYPTNLAINYAPNALGQPTQARDQSGYAYATGVSYYPNGAVKQFTYGNGIVHSMGQNSRQLPSRVISSGVLDNEFSYDRTGNVTAIRDLARGDHYTRWMTYDANDRLSTAASCSFGGDCTHRFTYDNRDNLTSWTLAGVKDYAEYVYDSSRHRLSNIKNSAGASVVALEYDEQGNLRHKNGQIYSFDYGNRLRAVVDKEHYRYDGHGRRVMAWVPTLGNILSQYSQSGQILYQENQRTGKRDENIYLAGSLVAIREWTAASGYAAKFHHTDALGSPVAVTDQAGQVVERNEYEPYGAVIGKPAYQGIGYAGHVQDAATGLTYMQQRYYDPQVGLFLSVDPVTAYSNPVGQFHRYRYASNNPYSRIDPDGGRDIYIGGGFDKDSSRIVQDFATRQQQLHPDRDIQYFGWHEGKQIRDAVAAPLAKGEPLNIIGHSLGGREAVTHANDTSARITNLITIDPVGASGDGSKPSNVSTWTTVTAQSSSGDFSDIVAYAGRRLEGTTDTSGADTSQTSSANHGGFPRMMNEVNALQKIEVSYPDKQEK